VARIFKHVATTRCSRGAFPLLRRSLVNRSTTIGALADRSETRLPESDQWRRVSVRNIPDDVLPNAEQQIYGECRTAALRPDSAAPSEIVASRKGTATG
jgi:hypothetical protein